MHQSVGRSIGDSRYLLLLLAAVISAVCLIGISLGRAPGQIVLVDRYMSYMSPSSPLLCGYNSKMAWASRYATEIQALEQQKARLQEQLSSRRIVPVQTPAAQPPRPVHLPAKRQTESTETVIRSLLEEKLQLERALTQMPGTDTETVALAPARPRRQNSLDELIRKKEALEREMQSYSKDQDPVVQGIMSEYRDQTVKAEQVNLFYAIFALDAQGRCPRLGCAIFSPLLSSLSMRA